MVAAMVNNHNNRNNRNQQTHIASKTPTVNLGMVNKATSSRDMDSPVTNSPALDSNSNMAASSNRTERLQ